MTSITPALRLDAPRRAPRAAVPTTPGARRARRITVAAIALLISLSLLTLLLSGNAVLAAMPTIFGAILYGIWTQPLRRSIYPLAFAQCAFFYPYTRADGSPLASGPLWTFLVEPGNAFMNIYLNKFTPASMLSLTGQELAYVLLLGLIVVRTLRGSRLDREGWQPQANVLFAFLALEVAAVAALEVWGAVNGGTMRSSLFQIRQFLWLPLQTFVLSYAMRDLRDFRTLGLTITAAALFKLVLGLYFMQQEVWSANLEVPFMTGHQDSVLYVVVFFGWIAAWLHERSWRRLVQAALVAGPMMAAIVVNDRRLAYVSIVGVFVAFYPLLRGRTKQQARKVLFAAAPLLLLYLALARTISTGIFAPGAELMGIANVEDSSTQWREIENTDLIYTLLRQRVLGTGWGHEFVEFIPLPDVSGAYREYLLMAHNSVLWLLGIAGIVGFTLLWMPLVVAVYLAARSYRFARLPMERTAAASAIAIIVCFVNQAYGDVGLGAANPVFLVALAMAMASKLAHMTGAWPSTTRVL